MTADTTSAARIICCSPRGRIRLTLIVNPMSVVSPSSPTISASETPRRAPPRPSYPCTANPGRVRVCQPEQATRTQQEQDDQERVDHQVPKRHVEICRPGGFDQPDHKAAEERARYRADSADQRGDQRLEPEHRPHAGGDIPVIDTDHG